MKIAILLPGHIRAWDYCKQNFLNTIYDKSYQIDVFIDTYNDIFRNDYIVNNEHEMNIIKTDYEIQLLFSDINVVYLSVEPQIEGPAEKMQIRKILKIVDAYENYEQNHDKYDLVVKSRCDILIDEKLDYKSILETCKNNNIIYIGKGGNDTKENDMFAVCNSDVFKIYGRRFLDCPYIHPSMSLIETKYNISYIQNIGMSIVRLDGNKKYVVIK